jgi:hypothetical protein
MLRNDGPRISGAPQERCAASGARGPTYSSCPALCRASTSFPDPSKKDVDGRDVPGHDEKSGLANKFPFRLLSHLVVIYSKPKAKSLK